MNDHYTKHAGEIIATIAYATVATSTKDGQPWNTPVTREYDEDLNIYWVSDKESQHSRNIAENDRVFIVIYDSTVPSKGEGVYIQATAAQVTDPAEILKAQRLKKGPDYTQPDDAFLGDSVLYMYKAVPQQVWMNSAQVTDGVFIRHIRVDIPLDALQLSLAPPAEP